MKAFTSIEQSKKLAEILPIESADMYYFTIIRNYPYSQGKIKAITKIMDGSFSSDYDIPCWSLAALLELMPKKIKYDGGIVYPEFHIWNNSFEYNNNADYVLYITNNYDNPVDACCEMIIHLHSKHLL